VANAKNSARLLPLCLPGSRIVVGEAFDQDVLADLLAQDGCRPLLLYPETAGAPAMAEGGSAGGRRLVVLDATWRKSRKMLHMNPALQALPRMPLRDTPPSHYLIRKAHAPDQLSTLEATCYALAQLEGQPHRYDSVIAAFDGFVAQQQAQAARGAAS